MLLGAPSASDGSDDLKKDMKALELYLQDLYKTKLVMSDTWNIVRELYFLTCSELSSDD